MAKKTELIGLKLTPEMYDFLEELATKDEITIQKVIRKLIKRMMEVGRNR